jgi:hypothetical protein
MINKTVTMPLELIDGIPRELLNRVLNPITSEGYLNAKHELVALMDAAPVVERQAEPIYQVRYLGEGGGGWIDVEKGEFNKDSLGISNYQTRTVFTSPPAPVAVVLPARNTDFSGSHRQVAYAGGWNACLDKVKELNR